MRSAISVIIIILIITSGVCSNLGISLIDKRKSDTLELGKSDKRLFALTDTENVGETGGERVSSGILDMDDLIGTWMMLNVHELSNTTNIVTTLNEYGCSILEFNHFVNLISLEVELNGIVLLDFWVGEADGPSVVSHNIRNFVLAEAFALYLAELET